ADRDRRAAADPTGPARQRLAIPGAGAEQDGPVEPVLAGPLQLLAASSRPAGLKGQAAGQQPGFEGRRWPPGRAEVVGGLLQLRDRDAGPLVSGQPGQAHDEPGPGGPPRALLAVELPHGPVSLVDRA